MLWRRSLWCGFVLAQLGWGQALSPDGDKPSPVPSRAKKQERARALDRGGAQTGVHEMAPTWTSAPQPAIGDGPQTGTSVFFSKNVLGKTAASGIVLDPEEMTASHASLPFGTLIKVTNTKNGKEVTLRVVDRISGVTPHILSVSERAARELDFQRQGIGNVSVTPLRNP